MKPIKLTVIAYDSPQARAYLEALKVNNYKVDKIIHLVSELDASKKKNYAFLPNIIRLPLCEKKQNYLNNYWVSYFKHKNNDTINTISHVLEEKITFAPQVINAIKNNVSFQSYACNHYQKVLIKNLEDPRLEELIKKDQNSYFLFTGGGLVRANLLDIPDKKFIHIHPGFLPKVRGADGMLWSLLLNRKPGMSSFFMEKGIDTGELISAREYGEVDFKLNDEIKKNKMNLYRLIFCFIDPIYRADHLINEVIAKHYQNFNNIQTKKQKIEDGLTYHFMHKKLRNKALQIMFPN